MTLFDVIGSAGIRSIGTVKSTLPIGMEQGSDYTILENAKKLAPSDYIYHPQLGFLSLKRPLTDGDVLAVAFQYSLVGSDEVFKVGELSTDGLGSEENIVLKLLRSELKQPGERIWDLMLKNVYSLGAYQMEPEGFRLEVLYRDDRTGVSVNSLQNAQTPEMTNRTLLNLMRLDVLDQNNFIKPKGDGYFDYVEGITVRSETGTVIFPTLEPFGRDLEAKLTDPEDEIFVFNELYTTTPTQASINFQNKDKYFLKGYYKSDASEGISLGAFNVPRGSVKVTSNGILLSEGSDYVVDYMGGRVQIINPAIEASGAPVDVSLENNSFFNQQIKRYIGIDVEHKFSDQFLMTGTYLNVNERPITQKVSYGSDPINNTMLGMSFTYDSEAPFLTKWVNKLPFQDTDVASRISVRADLAYLKPGTPSGIDLGGEATTYIDDFEASQIPISLMDVNAWKLSSTPMGDPDSGDFGADDAGLESGKKRAKLAWYSIDRLFYGGSSLQPSNIDEAELSRAEVSRVQYNELFPQTDLDLTQMNSLRTFDLAYFPSERGSYNYDAVGVEPNGDLQYPEDRWGGITRGLSTADFERANVEYIQFWMQDPYEHYSIGPEEGGPSNSQPIEEGALYFNLGNISEDVLKDGRKMFENGLPESGAEDSTEPTDWGVIPTQKSFLYTFNEVDADRLVQDVGLDGLQDLAEKEKFTELAYLEDPSSDNYRFFRGSQYDQEGASIITRYKDFNNTEGNSPTAGLSEESFPTTATTVPDAEDVNKDQTMNTIDAYYQYKVSLNAADLVVGKNNIVDKKTVLRTSGSVSKNITWYQFRIPIASGTPIGPISDFNSIRFMRMFLTKFKTPVVLRFGQLQLVRADWRRYTKNLHGGIADPSDDLDSNELNNFSIGVVNIEENDARKPIPYVLPPGIVREQLQGTTSIQYQNEQSLSVVVKDLQANETRAVYKNTISDLRMFKKLKMYVHAEGMNGVELNDGDLKAVLRIGSDLNDNYYQVEVPLKGTSFDAFSPGEIWPESNNFEIDLEALAKLKLARYEAFGASNFNQLYPLPVPGEEGLRSMRVKGNPNLSNIRTIVLGVQNISSSPQSAELWFNELRVAGFDNQGGWASVLSANANFADLAEVALTGGIQTMGFGNVEQRVNERSQEDVKHYGVSTNLNVGQLMPKKWGVKIPMSYAVSEEFRDPKFDPQYQDVPFSEAKGVNENSENARDYTKRKSISFVNVRKERTGETKKLPMPYDVENFSVSYSYNELFHKNYNIQKDLEQDVRTAANYRYSFPIKTIEPFKKSTFLKDKNYLALIRDFNFNLLPSSIGINSSIFRSYREQLSRNLIPGLPQLPTLKQRNFLFDWDYTIGYNLTRALKFNFRAANKHIYDAFEQDEEASEQVTLFSNFFEMGRPNNYNQRLEATYKLPIDKLPLLGFVSADYTYTADFEWQAGSQSYLEQVGNAIQNANTHNFSSNLNFSKFYKDVGIDKLFAPKRKRTKKVVQKDGQPKFAARTPKRAIKSKGKKSIKEKILKATHGLLTSVKTLRMSYTENNGTQLPGYIPTVGFLGRDRYAGGVAPTLGFVFGSQVDLRQRALENNWLVTRNINYAGDQEDDAYYNRTYAQTHYKKLDLTVSVKPIRDLDITVLANRIQTSNTSQQIDAVFDVTQGEKRLEPTQLSETGNFSMSYNMIRTAFDGDGDETFQKFLDNRNTVRLRLAAASGLDSDGYGLNSQEVLLPAFTAAYSGGSAKSTPLKAFKSIPLPNWRLTYKGLMKLKWFQKKFSSFVLTHAYRSSYTIGNYSNNIQYFEDGSGAPSRDANGNYFSKNILSDINLIDAFSPLVKIDLKLKNSLSFRGEINKDRTMNLNFSNNSLSDIRGTEYVFGLGYRIKNLKFRPSRSRRPLRGDLVMKADASLRQNLTSVRIIDTESTQITGGQNLFALKFSADYNIGKRLIVGFYYDQTASKYAISTSFPRVSVSAGFSMTYNIGN
jgi:cell surface protein SprA